MQTGPRTPVLPISPKEVALQKQSQYPNEVFEAFNELIAADFCNGSATVQQQEVTSLIKQKLTAASKSWGSEKDFLNLLNVEEVYESRGWSVSYDKPGFNEVYNVTFEFTAKR